MTVTILILSGGQSRRMGTDKAQLAFQGQTLLHWQQDRFEAAGYNVITGIPDRYPHFQGPLAGIDAALYIEDQPSAWLVIPVDMPGISVTAIQRLIAVGQSTHSPTCYERFPLPLFLPNSDVLKQTLRDWLNDKKGPRSVKALFNHLNGRALSVNWPLEEAVNINTPNDWQNFKERGSMK